jgi:hypothetical protein
MADHPHVQSILIQPLRVLIEALNDAMISREKEGEKIPPLFFCFDEVSNIPKEVLSALRRVTRLLRHEPVWTFVLSTESPLFGLAPALRDDPSNRI